MNRGRNGKKDVRLFLRPGKPEKANNLIVNSLWIVFYVKWHQLPIVEAIVNGAEPDGLSIAQIMKNIPEDWNEQRRLFGFPER